MVPGPQKQCSQVSDMQIQNTNTQIQIQNTVWVKFADTPITCATFFEKVMARGPQKQCS